MFIKNAPVLIYALLMLLIWAAYARMRARRNRHNEGMLMEAQSSGLTEPASLHPVIDTARCIGCASCVEACPEKNVLGIIRGKAALITASNCIGHGACRAACPTQSITLVFGTATRGVDIPLLKPNFETDVSGLYIAGELGGMGLIRNAIEQGRQSVDAIRRHTGIGTGDGLDLVIVGAGPAGIAASLAAKQHGLRVVTVEQDSLGGTVSHFPRGKLVMTAPVHLPLVGQVKFKETSKETLLEFWERVVEEQDLQIRFRERLEKIERHGNRFVVETSQGIYHTITVLLAIGRRGTPRRLDIPGEELPKVVYRLIDPEQYRDQRVLVVGGGDSALEAACSIAEQPGTRVDLAYRGDAFSRAKPKNRQRVEEAQAQGNLTVRLQTVPHSITQKEVTLEHDGQCIALDNDAIIVCAGGILPTPFLKSIGVAVETKFGTV